MKVDISVQNPALVSIMENNKQVITLDANFLIPPDRMPYSRQKYTFRKLQEQVEHLGRIRGRCQAA